MMEDCERSWSGKYVNGWKSMTEGK